MFEGKSCGILNISNRYPGHHIGKLLRIRLALDWRAKISIDQSEFSRRENVIVLTSK